MNTQDINLELLSELEIPKYHDYFVASQLNKGFSFQMRALRASQELTQGDLAGLAKTKQSVISRIETNGVSNLSVKSLLKLASAFNVGLVLRFVSLEHLLDWKNPISLEELAPQKSEVVLQNLKKAAKQKTTNVPTTNDNQIEPKRRAGRLTLAVNNPDSVLPNQTSLQFQRGVMRVLPQPQTTETDSVMNEVTNEVSDFKIKKMKVG
jgi:transcriptional regulator with XRE-family HTH domain